jgi:hypothetical protein
MSEIPPLSNVSKEQKERDRLGALNYQRTCDSFVKSGLVQDEQIVAWMFLEEAVREGHRAGAQIVKEEVLSQLAKEMAELQSVRQAEKGT